MLYLPLERTQNLGEHPFLRGLTIRMQQEHYPPSVGPAPASHQHRQPIASLYQRRRSRWHHSNQQRCQGDNPPLSPHIPSRTGGSGKAPHVATARKPKGNRVFIWLLLPIAFAVRAAADNRLCPAYWPGRPGRTALTSVSSVLAVVHST